MSPALLHPALLQACIFLSLIITILIMIIVSKLSKHKVNIACLTLIIFVQQLPPFYKIKKQAQNYFIPYPQSPAATMK